MKPSTLVSKVPNDSEIRNKEGSAKIKMKLNFESHHRARPPTPMETSRMVYVADRKEAGEILGQVNPRSYVAKTPSGVYHRNRIDLHAYLADTPSQTIDPVVPSPSSPLPVVETNSEAEKLPQTSSAPNSSAPVKSRVSGRTIRPPARFREN